MLKRCTLTIILASLLACGDGTKSQADGVVTANKVPGVTYASGLSVEKTEGGITLLQVAAPWPDAQKAFRYALVPKELAATVTLNRDEYDVIISVPVESVVVTSTTHIPALEALGVLDRLVGFPETRYISSPAARERIGEGHIKDLGSNESINTEMVLELQPELVVGFAVGERNKAYDLLQRSSIPVVYNGDWTEESPLGKAEWIKFFAPFFGLEQKADSLFRDIEVNYMEAMELAENSEDFPTVLSGALYKDIWYLPGGSSWAARFLEDANAAYLWNDNGDIGSLSLSVEHVLERGADADYWISPSQYTSYAEMEQANRHYRQFKAFRDQKVYTFARTRGATGGYLYYELGPSRPDLVLRDLVHILHPGLLPGYQPYFFKPLN